MRYSATCAFVVLAVLLADVSQPIFPGGGIFLLLLIPVMVCSIMFGTGGLALLLGMAGAMLLVPLRGHPWLHDPAGVARIALYVLEGAFVLLLAAALRHASGGRTTRFDVAAVGTGMQLIEPLTRREQEVLRLAAGGLSIDEIGRALYLSRNTVKSHLAHAYGKLGAHNRAEAVAAGLHSGCLAPDALTIRAPQITAGAGAAIPARSTERGAIAD